MLTKSAVHKSKNSLQEDLNKHLITLQREQSRSEKLEKQVSGQLETHKKLVEALTKIPEDLSKELTKDGGMISTILTAEKTTNTK
jgi:hypothetical protein